MTSIGLICKSLWIKASAKWLNENIKLIEILLLLDKTDYLSVCLKYY